MPNSWYPTSSDQNARDDESSLLSSDTNDSSPANRLPDSNTSSSVGQGTNSSYEGGVYSSVPHVAHNLHIGTLPLGRLAQNIRSEERNAPLSANRSVPANDPGAYPTSLANPQVSVERDDSAHTGSARARNFAAGSLSTDSHIAPVPPSPPVALLPPWLRGAPRSGAQNLPSNPVFQMMQQLYMQQLRASDRPSHASVRADAPPPLPRLMRTQVEAHSGVTTPLSGQNGARVFGVDTGEQHLPNSAPAIHLEQLSGTRLPGVGETSNSLPFRSQRPTSTVQVPTRPFTFRYSLPRSQEPVHLPRPRFDATAEIIDHILTCHAQQDARGRWNCRIPRCSNNAGIGFASREGLGMHLHYVHYASRLHCRMLGCDDNDGEGFWDDEFDDHILGHYRY